ncbi:MAG: addiction module protein [Nocardioidaceae bacterium]
MVSNVEEAVAAILAVEDLDERAVLVHRLEDSLHPAKPQAVIAAAWRAEIGSRVDAILTGKVELVDAEETDGLIAAELDALDH